MSVQQVRTFSEANRKLIETCLEHEVLNDDEGKPDLERRLFMFEGGFVYLWQEDENEGFGLEIEDLSEEDTYHSFHVGATTYVLPKPTVIVTDTGLACWMKLVMDYDGELVGEMLVIQQEENDTDKEPVVKTGGRTDMMFVRTMRAVMNREEPVEMLIDWVQDKGWGAK